VTLGQAYWLTDEKRYASEAADLLRDWIAANPYGVGINWSSSLEVSYRMIAWCWTISMLRESDACTNDEYAELLAQIWVHATHIERYLSYYFSPNTHLTGEALGLFYAGVLFPEFEDAARWRELGQRILIDESQRQILADGVYFEQATCYQRYTIEIYLHFLIMAERNGIALPPDIGPRVERMLEALLLLNQPDGTMPMIGDADGGWLAPLAAREANDPRAAFAVGAAVFGRSDFARAAGGLQPEVVWLLGRDGVAQFDAARPAAPRMAASQLLGAGGYAVMRSDWSPVAHQMIMDVGPLGCPYASAHGHADLLSLQCQAFGENYLVDPGTYCYTPDPAWRNHFRGSSAHSTVLIDGQGQVEPRGPFAWESQPAVRLRAWRSDAEQDFVDAEHSAYARLGDPVTHRRRVLFVKPYYWVVVDDLNGAATHQFELRFQFTPRTVRLGPGPWASAPGRAGTGLWIAPFSSIPLSASLHEGQLDPIEGWVSPDYGQREPAPALVYSATAALPQRLITLVLPVTRLLATPPAVDILRDATGRLAGLRFVETDDTVHVDEHAIVARRSGVVQRV
jgi:hypothetical protein